MTVRLRGGRVTSAYLLAREKFSETGELFYGSVRCSLHSFV
jgi:hypothetical protein